MQRVLVLFPGWVYFATGKGCFWKCYWVGREWLLKINACSKYLLSSLNIPTLPWERYINRISCNPHNNSMRQVLLLSPFCRRGSKDSERLNNWLKVTQLFPRGARIQTQGLSSQSLCFYSLQYTILYRNGGIIDHFYFPLCDLFKK